MQVLGCLFFVLMAAGLALGGRGRLCRRKAARSHSFLRFRR